MKKIFFTDLGLSDYKSVWDYQLRLSDELRQSLNNNSKQPVGYLIFCEHPHVFTLGRSGSVNNLLVKENFLKEKNIAFYKTDRGGDITYHGPGQIVGYPILDLKSFGIGVKEYVHKMEESIIQTLNESGISSERLPGATGVWLDSQTKNARKISAIGIRVSRGITMHGFALNINTDLSFFNFINPCGFTDKAVTSAAKELGAQQNIEEIKPKLKYNFAKVFDVELKS
ncbi:MAG: lipoyl(octanoyl) transferase LipB [Bacteroidota bacterium]